MARWVSKRTFCAALLAVSWAVCAMAEQRYEDPTGDAVVRRTDPGADGAYDPEVQGVIDLGEIEIGAWRPDDPATDLFEGEFASDSEFLRLDLTIAGLVNPPGSADPFSFDPFAFGEHPVYGFVEIDVDGDVLTGGEVSAPQYRYLGNVARFGGLPKRESLEDRVAVDVSAFDGDVETAPFVDRHGEEFHLALLGSVVERGTIEEVDGNGDEVFDAGETWDLAGPFFHRAHAFEAFSFIKGGRHPGEYAPTVWLRFQHDPIDDQTRLSLIVPLTNVGAAQMTGALPEDLDLDPENQASVLEALDDLYASAEFFEMFPTGLPEQALIDGWADRDPNEYLKPSDWEMTALLGTSYSQPDPSGLYFVWTDVYPDAVVGDFDGDGDVTELDEAAMDDFIIAYDASDGTVDGSVVVIGFGENFSIYDLNYDGVVDHEDVTLIEDGDVLLSSIPYADSSLCRSAGNVVRLTFSVDITEPPPGELLVQQMFAGGAFGPDLSGGFDVSIEQDGDGFPRTLRLVDAGLPDLQHGAWYTISGNGGWLGGASFDVAYVVQVGDVSNDGAVLNLDAGLINGAIPEFVAADQDRRDIDGDGTILNDDVSTANFYIPSFQVPKPDGH